MGFSSVGFRLGALDVHDDIVQSWEPASQDKQVQIFNLAKNRHSHVCYIVPPHISEKIGAHRRLTAAEGSERREVINAHKAMDKFFRDFRKENPHTLLHDKRFNPSKKDIIVKVWDAQAKTDLPGALVYDSRHPTKLDAESDACHAVSACQRTHEYYLENHGRYTINNHGAPYFSTINFDKNYDNAFWNGRQMIYGEGDGEYFGDFVKFLDVCAHEMTHGVTGDLLEYSYQSGALNEHISDVFGLLVVQYVSKQTVDQADWLVGKDLISDPTTGKKYALRSFKNPGSAYNFEPLGKDPQPAKFPDLYKGDDDDGGVHINSGIPNHAFYLFATALGGHAWDKAGKIWYATVQTPNNLKPNANFQDFAAATLKMAKKLYPAEPKVYEELLKAWQTVEVLGVKQQQEKPKEAPPKVQRRSSLSNLRSLSGDMFSLS